MDKNEILSKSRKENKDRDLYTLEVQSTAGTISSLVALVLATVFFVVQIVTGGGFDYGLYAIVLSVGATGAIVRSVRMRRRRDILLAVITTAATLVLSAAHLGRLIATSTIL